MSIGRNEKYIALFDPITCEKKILTGSQIAKLFGVSRGTIGSVKTRRQKYKEYYIVDLDTPTKELKQLIQGIELENEVWKCIPHSITEVSNYGRYRSNGVIRYISSSNANNAAQICIVIDGKKRNYNAHYWVAVLFLGPKPQGAISVHKDGNKFNNRADNLKYASRAFINKQNAIKGKAIPVLQIDPQTNEVVEEYTSMAEAAKAVYTTRDTICRAVKKGYESMGYLWKIDKNMLAQ